MSKHIHLTMLIFCVFGIYCVYSNAKSKVKIVADFKRDNSNLSQVNSEFEQSLLQQYNFNDKILKKDLILFDNDTLRIRNINNHGLLIFYFRESSCNPCINRELAQIAKLQKSIKSRIMIIANYNDFKMLKILIDQYGLKTEYYCLKQDETLVANDQNLPATVIFNVDDNYIIKNAYIPAPNYPNLSNIYFSSLKK